MTDAMPFSPKCLPTSEVRRSFLPAKALPEPRLPRPWRPRPTRTRLLVPADDRISQGLLLGLFAVTLPATVYSLLQVW